jgi:Flp pilus assembly protein TadG
LAAKTDWDTYTGAQERPGNNLTKNNSSGFSALPGGYRIGKVVRSTARVTTVYWWSATEDDASYAWTVTSTTASATFTGNTIPRVAVIQLGC